PAHSSPNPRLQNADSHLQEMRMPTEEPMSQQRPILFPALFALLSLAASCAVLARTAHAAACIEKPNAAAPQGEHWYYRTDRAVGRQCWYLGPEDSNGNSARRASARRAPDASVQSVASQSVEQPANSLPPATTKTSLSTAADQPSWPVAAELPLMPPLFQLAPAPAPTERTQT